MTTPLIPVNSTILVTGATGFLASHIVRQLLKRGYKVRGTVRDIAAASWLKTSPSFAPYAAQLELVSVPDLSAAHAFDAAISGVAGIIHVASIISLSRDPAAVIPQTIAGTRSVLEAAAAEPSVRAVVYTSSIVAGVDLEVGEPRVFEQDTWNTKQVEEAWKPEPFEFGREMAVYTASKTEAERAVWEFVETQKPHFQVATVLPAQVIGAPLHPKHNDIASHHLGVLYNGRIEGLLWGAGPFVDAGDTAILHVAALLDPSAHGKRIFAFGQEFTRDEILEIMRRKRPDHTFVDNFDSTHTVVHADLSLPVRLLKDWNNQDGWRSIEDSVTEYLDSEYVA